MGNQLTNNFCGSGWLLWGKNHKVEVSRPYYTNKQRRIDRPQNSQPYYANKDRKKEKASIRTPDDEYTTSHKQIRRNRGDFE